MNIRSRDKIIKKLIDSALYCLNIDHDEKLLTIKKFLTYFFATKGPEFFQNLNNEQMIKQYSATLCDVWHHFSEKKPNSKPQIYFYQDSFNPEQTFVSIINIDQPFLVSTIHIILKDLDLTPTYFVHPVMSTKRDADGRLQEILSVATDDLPHIHDESVIHFALPSSEDALKATQFSNLVSAAFSDINLITIDNAQLFSKLERNYVCYFTLSDVERDGERQTQYLDVAKFCNWLNKDVYTPCGYRYVPFENQKLDFLAARDVVGLFKSEVFCKNSDLEPSLEKSILDKTQNLLSVEKLNARSSFNRGSRFDGINILDVNEQGTIMGLHQHVGQFTAKFYECSPKAVPILDTRVKHLFKDFGFKEDWYNGRLLTSIIESIPVDILLTHEFKAIFNLCDEVLRLQNHVSVFFRHIPNERNIIFLVYVAKDKYSHDLKEAFKAHIEARFKSIIRSEHIYLREATFARIVFSLDLNTQKMLPKAEILAKELTQVSKTWDEHLTETIEKNQAQEISKLFPVRFKNNFSPKNALDVYNTLNEVLPVERKEFTKFGFTRNGKKDYIYAVKNGDGFQLTEILSIFEKFGLEIHEEFAHYLGEGNNKSVHLFHVTFTNSKLHIHKIQKNLLEGLALASGNKTDRDILNSLIVSNNLNAREINAIRGYVAALRQMRIGYSNDYIHSCLTSHPKIVAYFVGLFAARFHPEYHGMARESLFKEKVELYIKTLEKLDDDRILRRIYNLITATVRTNFYQYDQNNLPKSYISYKFDCSKIDQLPAPRPLYEIFVFSYEMEGCHLRGGRVARGGLRWSDRLEDYRTEVLALMKAQMLKNSVIVPLGSKGGFVAKHYERRRQLGTPNDKLRAYVVESYQTFIRGLLDITDNRAGEIIQKPTRCICHDDVDPYLVVAADKGTATFSDIANQISKNYGFWLGDAFASGGSRGYDHKKMGITAKGAWISIEHHFHELDLDIFQDSFRVVGVGDMGGDVFGNGMLTTPKSLLIAAFNHEHIFVDPSPDSDASYAERKRLFDLPGSKWTDYNPQFISKGGGVFKRSEKSITLTPEIKTAFSIPEHVKALTPSELINNILKAHVDLVWFGGIGTYIMGDAETPNDVNDHVNDDLRVQASEVQARVIGEGANLGITQNARIEMALNGIRVNTDAIDNSAGVDCSDHEVNIKILCNQLIQAKKITLKQRDILLEKMTDEVGALVLKDNAAQNHILSVMENRVLKDLFSYEGLMKSLEKEEDLPLNREIEILPTHKTLQKRHSQSQAITRPELAIIMAYVKINMYMQLLNEIDLKKNNSFLLEYFPSVMQQDYPKMILDHSLNREITATAVVNYLVNRLGALFFHQARLTTQFQLKHIVSACLEVIHIFDFEKVWSMIGDKQLPGFIMCDLWNDSIRIIGRLVSIRLRGGNLNLDKLKEQSKPFISSYEALLPAAPNEDYHTRCDRLMKLANFYPVIMEALIDGDISEKNAEQIANVHHLLIDALHLNLFDEIKAAITPFNDWERMVKNSLADDLSLLEWRFIKKSLHADVIFTQNQRADFVKKLLPLQTALTSDTGVSLSHLTYGVKLMQQWLLL